MEQTSPPKVRKRLIVCCDGTSNDSINTSAPPTNVSRIARCIKDEDDYDNNEKVIQLVYYRSGVGTGTSKVTNIVDSICGRG